MLFSVFFMGAAFAIFGSSPVVKSATPEIDSLMQYASSACLAGGETPTVFAHFQRVSSMVALG